MWHRDGQGVEAKATELELVRIFNNDFSREGRFEIYLELRLVLHLSVYNSASVSHCGRE